MTTIQDLTPLQTLHEMDRIIRTGGNSGPIMNLKDHIAPHGSLPRLAALAFPNYTTEKAPAKETATESDGWELTEYPFMDGELLGPHIERIYRKWEIKKDPKVKDPNTIVGVLSDPYIRTKTYKDLSHGQLMALRTAWDSYRRTTGDMKS